LGEKVALTIKDGFKLDATSIRGVVGDHSTIEVELRTKMGRKACARGYVEMKYVRPESLSEMPDES
jgi:hypothetical protein